MFFVRFVSSPFFWTHSEVRQQVHTVGLSEARDLQSSGAVVHHSVTREPPAPPSGASSPGPERTSATDRAASASTRNQESTLGGLVEATHKEGKPWNVPSMIGWHMKFTEEQLRRFFSKSFWTTCHLMTLWCRSGGHLDLELCVFDPQHSRVLSSLSLLIQVQLCIQQLPLCL